MSAKEYLMQIRKMQFAIRHKIDALNELREMTCSVGGISNDDKVQTSASGDALANKVIAIIEREEHIRNQIAVYEVFLDTIMSEIDSLDNPVYSDLLHRRYVKGESLLTIAKAMRFEYETIRHMHGRALEAFSAKVDTQRHIDL